MLGKRDIEDQRGALIPLIAASRPRVRCPLLPCHARGEVDAAIGEADTAQAEPGGAAAAGRGIQAAAAKVAAHSFTSKTTGRSPIGARTAP